MFKAEHCTEASFKSFCGAGGGGGGNHSANSTWVTLGGTDCFSGQDNMGTCAADDVAPCKAQCLTMGNCGGVNWPHEHFKPSGCYSNTATDSKLTLYALKPPNTSGDGSGVAVTAGGSVYVQGRNARSVLTQDTGSSSSSHWSLSETPASADLIWLINRCYLGTYEPSPQQALNMLPWDLPLVDKARLVTNIQRYDANVQTQPQMLRGEKKEEALGLSASFVPTTYRVADNGAWEIFLAEMANCSSRHRVQQVPCGPWILKRTDLSNGEGATILPDPAAWAASGGRQRLLELPGHVAASYIVQRYIDEPLLLAGRKSELRTYWLVASLDPLVVLYHPGTVRLNAALYSRADYDDDLVHITNMRRQLQAASLNASQKANHGAGLGLKWTHEQLAADLAERGYGETAWSKLQSQIKQIIVRAINATRSELSERVGETRGKFQLFGADFIVEDSNGTLRPWLTEVQVGPGLSHDEPVKAAIVPRMVRDAAAIGVAAVRAATVLAETVGGEGGERAAVLGAMARLGEGTVFDTLVNEAA